MKTRRQYDDEFKRMAVELADAKGSLKATADELGITPQILTRWCRERVATQGTRAGSPTHVGQEQQEIVRLKKALKQAELDRTDFYDSSNNGGIKIFIFFSPLYAGKNPVN